MLPMTNCAMRTLASLAAGLSLASTGCGSDCASWALELPAISLSVMGVNGTPIRICWSDDAAFTASTPACGRLGPGRLSEADVRYRVFYEQGYGSFTYTLDELFAEMPATDAVPVGCFQGERFGATDATRAYNEADCCDTHGYSVCRVINGVQSGCSEFDTVSWCEENIGGSDAGSDARVDAAIDASAVIDSAMPTADASCDGGPLGGC